MVKGLRCLEDVIKNQGDEGQDLRAAKTQGNKLCGSVTGNKGREEAAQGTGG